MENQLKVGLLSKRASSFPFTWQERNFILTSSKLDYYFGTVHKGTIPLSAATSVARVNVKDKPFAFEVVNGTRKTLITGVDSNDSDAWVAAIAEVISSGASADVNGSGIALLSMPQSTGDEPLIREIQVANKILITNIDDVNGLITFTLDQVLRIGPEYCQRLTSQVPIPPNLKSRFVRLHPEEMEEGKAILALFPAIDVVDSTSLVVADAMTFLMSAKTKAMYITRSASIVMESKMELHRFPFDRQLFEIEFHNCRDMYVDWPEDIRWDAPTAWIGDPRWKGNEVSVSYHNEDWKIHSVASKFHMLNLVNSTYIVDIAIERDPWFYINNCCVVVYIVCMVACFVVAIDPRDFADRCSVTITLLLTIVAFKFVVAGFIPKISYLTLLDQYMMSGFVMLMLVICENFVVAMTSEDDESVAKKIDVWFAIAFASVWNVYHLVIIIAANMNMFTLGWDHLEEQRMMLLEHSNSVKKSTPERSSIKHGDDVH